MEIQPIPSTRTPRMFLISKAIFLLINFFPSEYGELGLKSRVVSPEATEMPKSGMLFCYVSTSEKFHQDRVCLESFFMTISFQIPSVAETWLPYCDSWHIYSNSNKYLDFVPYHVIFHEIPDDYDLLFWKSRLALFYSYSYVSSRKVLYEGEIP